MPSATSNPPMPVSTDSRPPLGRNEAALITLAVTTFREIATTKEARRYCAVKTKFSGHSMVKKTGEDGNPTFRFAGRANLRVLVTNGRAGSKERFIPVGIAFKQRRNDRSDLNDSSDPIGQGNFYREEMDLKEGSITIRNRFEDPGTYEFFVLIQKLSNGALGLIDPGIENDPQGGD
ncbi:MAG TPA: hypothetical protein VM029_17935 [Opitutaceae bacterium]|nr:hypothetical protein [Opitutaceae bacterium]